ncbi:MAG: hypothetical protein ACYC2X_03155 [Coriobacteriia bacterium]
MSHVFRVLSARAATAIALGVLLGALVLGAASCGPAEDAPAGTPGVDIAADPVAPAPWDLTTPELAVRSYLDWVSFSYRMANSEIPTATMTPGESVRVDSYIQLNRMEGKGLEQALESIELMPVSEDASSAVLTAREEWAYRYFSLETLEYLSELTRESYETTYTLVKDAPGWLVDRVEAQVTGAE